MEIGTLRCKLFGHKFLGKEVFYRGNTRVVATEPINYCWRCGITKEELNK